MLKHDSKGQSEVAQDNQGGHRLKKVSSNRLNRVSMLETEWIEQVTRHQGQERQEELHVARSLFSHCSPLP